MRTFSFAKYCVTIKQIDFCISANMTKTFQLENCASAEYLPSKQTILICCCSSSKNIFQSHKVHLGNEKRRCNMNNWNTAITDLPSGLWLQLPYESPLQFNPYLIQFNPFGQMVVDNRFTQVHVHLNATFPFQRFSTVTLTRGGIIS